MFLEAFQGQARVRQGCVPFFGVEKRDKWLLAAFATFAFSS
jgi:hypothetical protein